MKWTKEAHDALSKVPFFVRGRVRQKVEQEAAHWGAKEVTIDHVRACQRKYIERMEDEVKGYQLETCFGQSGCLNRAVGDSHLGQELEQMLAQRKLKEFLQEKVPGPLKLHYEFRVAISDCPNACSRPQIADIGIVGALRPRVAEDCDCTECGRCEETCREGAITLHGPFPLTDFDRCVCCGQCITACPTGTLAEDDRGYRIMVGGKLGRHPRLAVELPGIFSPREVVDIVNRCLDHYQAHCREGERFGEIIERTGIGALFPEQEGKEVIAGYPARPGITGCALP